MGAEVENSMLGEVAAPQDELLRLMMGAWASQVTFVFARLGVADCLADGPLPARIVARDSDTDPDALLRLLRAAATLGLLTEADPDCFRLTELGECLRSDA